MAGFACIQLGRERRPPREFVPRHRHAHGYAALVLAGGYEEAGDRGRRFVSAGDLILHGAFEAHLDRFAARGAEILNLDLPETFEPAFAFARLGDPDRVARLAERDGPAACAALLAAAEPVLCSPPDWPDDLAAALTENPNLSLGRWASARGLADATVSRGFRRVYGVSPSAFRAQARGRSAWRELFRGAAPLSALALQAGFSDQAHMTRAVCAVTGRSPGRWRRLGSNGFKTAEAAV